MKSIKIENPPVAIKLTREQAQSLGIDPTADEQRGEMKTRGPWNTISSYKAICISNKYDRSGIFPEIASTEIFGKRTLSNPRQSGYCLEGYVSIKGEKYSAYTSDLLIEVEGKLISIATINARQTP